MTNILKRSWVVTEWNLTEDNMQKWQAFASGKCKRWLCVGALENCPTTGKDHMHISFVMKSPTNIDRLHKQFPRCRFEIMQGSPRQARAYSVKCAACQFCNDGDYVNCENPRDPTFEFGQCPADRDQQIEAGKKQGEITKEMYKSALDLATAGKWDILAEEHPDILVKNVSGLKKAAGLLRKKQVANADVDCRWYFGPTGSGKSRIARHLFDGVMEDGDSLIYDKGLNKWFDGYKDGQTLLIEEIGKDHAFLGNLLKRWADRYPFSVEVKGGFLGGIRPPRVIITSNYHIKDIWDDASIYEPLLRRFKVIECRLPGSNDNVSWPGSEVIRPMEMFAEGGVYASSNPVETVENSLEGLLDFDGLIQNVYEEEMPAGFFDFLNEQV